MCTNKKVLMLHPYRNERSVEFPIVSVGFVAIANALIENGFEVIGINMPLEYGINPDFSLKVLLEEEMPDKILISFQWYEFLKGTMAITKECKSYSETVPVIIGGMSATLLYKELMDKYYEIDYIVLGDAIEATLNLCHLEKGLEPQTVGNVVYRKGKDVIINERRYKDDINKLNYTDLNFLKHKEEYLLTDINGYNKHNKKNFWLCVARGCPYNCSYCGGSNKAQRKIFLDGYFVYRTFENIKKDLFYLGNKVDTISLTHDIELLPYWRELIKFISSLQTTLYYESFQLPSSETIDYLGKFLGRRCTVAITAISGNVDIRNREGKFFTNDELINVVTQLANNNIQCDVYFTLNCLGESIGMFRRTILIAEKIYKKNVNSFCMPYFQEEIGSIRMDKNKTIAESMQELLNYLDTTEKTKYFYSKDTTVLLKLLMWNKSVCKIKAGENRENG